VVEVDCVAHGGHTWVEVKAHESFGVDSVHWLGAAGHVKGLRRQLEEWVQVGAARAGAPQACNCLWAGHRLVRLERDPS
jgi:hypothetical protein